MNNNDDHSELGEQSSDCGHQTGCIVLRTRILPKLRLGRRYLFLKIIVKDFILNIQAEQGSSGTD